MNNTNENREVLLKVDHLCQYFKMGNKELKAVDDVSFSIKEGEFIAVIGASGSGKSTLINLISGLEKPTHGCVYVHDVNLTQLSLEEQISFRRWHIGVVFQKYNLIPAMNVFENIVLPAKLFCFAQVLRMIKPHPACSLYHRFQNKRR